MANKRTNQSVPATETGAIPGDGKGSRNNMKMPTKGGRNATTEQAHRGAGQLAPRPQTSKSQYMSQSSATSPTQAGLARVQGRPSSPSGRSGTAGSFTPVQNNAMTNLRNTSVGQPNPNTAAAATTKPKRRGLGAAFYGES